MAEEGVEARTSSALSRKIAGQPGYVWVGLGLGGFLIFHKLKTGSWLGGGGAGSGPAAPSGGIGTDGALSGGGGGGGGPDLSGLEQEIQQLLSQQTQQNQPTTPTPTPTPGPTQDNTAPPPPSPPPPDGGTAATTPVYNTPIPTAYNPVTAPIRSRFA